MPCLVVVRGNLGCPVACKATPRRESSSRVAKGRIIADGRRGCDAPHILKSPEQTPELIVRRISILLQRAMQIKGKPHAVCNLSHRAIPARTNQ